jgi:anti-sigma regulatory factor (Ser/Thr protein kinase)
VPSANVNQAIDDLLSEAGAITSGALAARLGISRQAAHRHLRAAVERGALVLEGSGRGARYRARTPKFRYAIAGSAEDRILADVEGKVPALAKLTDDEARAFRYVFAEMVNNALDHSAGKTVHVVVEVLRDRVTLEVVDDGIGAFERVRRERGLASAVEAAAELTKGKVTTMPDRHSGEGIFFTSKVATRFELDANGHVLLVDNERNDVAVLAGTARRGTRVSISIGRPLRRRLIDVFAEYTTDHQFDKTRTVVRLFGIGLDFVSRSEARRLMNGLERFGHIVLDFDGVAGIGQGFADEVFRVFASAHPEIVIEPVRMNDDVAFFVDRARRRS